MLIRHRPDVMPSEITPRERFERRRDFLRAGAVLAAGAGLGVLGLTGREARAQGTRLANVARSPLSTDEKPTPYKDVTTYNNFYEFGTDKDEPHQYSKGFRTRPWTVEVSGAVARPRTFGIDDLLGLAPLEERVYRMRCVEGWSMVIPWVGYPFNEIVRRVEPTGNAKFVEFVTLLDPDRMPGQRSPVLDWLYVEGLRMDEARHPLTLLTLGLYGEVLPNQNGAPVRIVVPWKYGFKSGKSIVKIRFVEKQPQTSWMLANSREYGFYSNVNPNVDHPRWSQATERRIGEIGKRKTLMFNGYGDQVASMYAGMDLRKYY